MAKRRRERDRPKSGPDALYNPNKRVLLSYASDEDDAATVPEPPVRTEGSEASLPPDEQIANHQIQEYVEDEDEEEEGDEGENDENDEATDGDFAGVHDHGNTHRPDRSSARKDGKRNPKKNDWTNQYPALGSTDYDWDGDDGEGGDDYDDEDDALAYLRAVRTERVGIPLILNSSTTSAAGIPLESTGDDPCLIKNGVCAAPVVQASVSTAQAAIERSDPQHVFTDALVARFLQQRQLLHLPTTAEKIAELDERHPISCPRKNKKAYMEWVKLLSTADPLPAQLRSLDSETVFTLLELIQKHLLTKGQTLTPTTSAWAWSLLARLDDVGCMNNDDVFQLRELAKQALLVQFSLTDPQIASQLEAYQSGHASNEGSTILAVAASNVPDAEAASPPTSHTPENMGSSDVARANTLATLDMILIVVGHVFGQRDIFELRRSWSAL